MTGTYPGKERGTNPLFAELHHAVHAALEFAGNEGTGSTVVDGSINGNYPDDVRIAARYKYGYPEDMRDPADNSHSDLRYYERDTVTQAVVAIADGLAWGYSGKQRPLAAVYKLHREIAEISSPYVGRGNWPTIMSELEITGEGGAGDGDRMTVVTMSVDPEPGNDESLLALITYDADGSVLDAKIHALSAEDHRLFYDCIEAFDDSLLVRLLMKGDFADENSLESGLVELRRGYPGVRDIDTVLRHVRQVATNAKADIHINNGITDARLQRLISRAETYGPEESF